MAFSTLNGLSKASLPDQFGRYALGLLCLAGLAGLFQVHVIGQLIFWLLICGGVSLTLFSLLARPLGSPQWETWLSVLLYGGLLALFLLMPVLQNAAPI